MASQPATKTSFADATKVTSLTTHTYRAHFPDDWCIGSVPHGGFVTSCFLRVAALHFSTTLSAQNQPHCITLHLDFLRRTQSGPALFTVQDTKLGRQTSIIHITLSQGNRDEVVGYITHSNMATETGVTLDTEFTLEPAPPKVDLVALKEDRDANWARQGAMPFASFRKASTKVVFHFPRAGQPMRAIGDEWCCFANGERFTAASLGYVADMFPMPVEAWRESGNPYDVKKGGRVDAKAKYWYPTLLLNLDVKKAIPEEGIEWIFVRVRAKQIKNGRMDLELIIMDADGDVVALSHHVCLVLGAERNLAERRKTEGSKI